MRPYYDDPDKITFDRAELLVGRYIRKYRSRRRRVTCKEVAKAFGVEESHHNLIRINTALDDQLEIARPSGAKATQYRITEHE